MTWGEIVTRFEKEVQGAKVEKMYHYKGNRYLVEAPSMGTERDLSDPFYLITPDPWAIFCYSPVADLDDFFECVDKGEIQWK